MKMRIGHIRILLLAATLMAVVVNLVGCSNVAPAAHEGDMHAAKQNDGDQASQPQAQAESGEVIVVIQDFVFKPAELTVSAGTKVTWINKDEAPHTATSVDKKFNSGGMDTDDKFSFVFNDKGEYPYFCALHPQMKATITVK
jgi:plastocyanin